MAFIISKDLNTFKSELNSKIMSRPLFLNAESSAQLYAEKYCSGGCELVVKDRFLADLDGLCR